MAVKVNHGDRGILAHDDAPGYVLARRCAAAPGKVPLFGQDGRFTIEVAGIPILIELHGMFGLGGPLPGFEARAVDLTRPFISDTGYRSFLGYRCDPVRGMTTADFAARVIAAHIAGELKGRLVAIRPIAARPRLYHRQKQSRAAAARDRSPPARMADQSRGVQAYQGRRLRHSSC